MKTQCKQKTKNYWHSLQEIYKMKKVKDKIMMITKITAATLITAHRLNQVQNTDNFPGLRGKN